MKKYLVEVVVEKDADGYMAYCPSIQGCYTQGKSYERVMDNVRDVIRLHLADRKAGRQKMPSTESISVTTLELSV